MKMHRYYLVMKSKIKYINCRSLSLICFGVAVIILSTNSYYIYKYFDKNITAPKHQVKIEPFEGEKIVHLDLKGAPPKINYLKDFLTLIKRLGATGVLIEYEDMFPYSGNLRNISAGNAYPLKFIKEIDYHAKFLGLQIIPLVQTFGHLGFLLKNQEFKHLRESQKNMEVICPSNKEAKSVLIEMISQVLEAHRDAKIIHIGADEVFTLGTCSKCAEILRDGVSADYLFLQHMSSIASEIKKLNPGIKILMWDDHLRHMDYSDLEGSNLSKYVEPVIWNYARDVSKYIKPKIFTSYNEIFRKIWIASAFKGASKSNQYAPDVYTYLLNHKSWMKVVQHFKSQIKFSGIILTGWQRFDHFSVLCELLPVATPTLALCLHYIQGINYLQPKMKTASVLGCANSYGLLYPEVLNPACAYPGADMMKSIIKLNVIEVIVDELLQSERVKVSLNNYNLKNRYSNPWFIELTIQILREKNQELFEVKTDLIRNMMPIYDRHTIIEWLETYIEPLFEKIQVVLTAGNEILNVDTKPRRPFTLKENESSQQIKKPKNLN